MAVLTALGGLDRGAPDALPQVVPPAAAKGIDGLPAPCGPGTLPEGPVCVRIPDPAVGAGPGSDPGAPSALLRGAPPREPGRSARGFDEIPRRPERPADPAGYVFPVGTAERPPRVLGGLEGVDGSSPIRPFASGAERGGLHLAARPGEKVVSVALEHQEGAAEVVFAGDLFGPTVVTLHNVNEGGRPRTYLLLHGRLDRADPGATVGAKLDPGAPIGFARTSEAGHLQLIEVYVEARQVREGVTIKAPEAKQLTDGAVAIPIDPRNVLARR